MATPTDVVYEQGRWQFHGLFSDMWIVSANINWGSIGSNTSEMCEITVPGLNPATDFVITFNRQDDYTAHSILEVAHIHTDMIHLITHNTAGGSFNAPDARYRFLIGRYGR